MQDVHLLRHLAKPSRVIMPNAMSIRTPKTDVMRTQSGAIVEPMSKNTGNLMCNQFKTHKLI